MHVYTRIHTRMYIYIYRFLLYDDISLKLGTNGKFYNYTSHKLVLLYIYIQKRIIILIGSFFFFITDDVIALESTQTSLQFIEGALAPDFYPLSTRYVTRYHSFHDAWPLRVSNETREFLFSRLLQFRDTAAILYFVSRNTGWKLRTLRFQNTL